LIGIIIGIIFIVFGGLWIYERSFTETVVKYSTFLNLFLTAIIALITYLYFLATKRIVEKNSESVALTYKILNLSEEKEKDKRTLFYLEKLDINRNDKLYIDRTRLGQVGVNRELFINISLINTISYLYYKNKLNGELIFPLLSNYTYSFFLVFHSEIFQLLTTPGLYGTDFNYYENFIDLIEEIIEKEIKKVKEYETVDTYRTLLDSIKKIKGKIRK